MPRVLEGLRPERVFYYFEEISRIPRGSGNEKGVSDYVRDLFAGKGFAVEQDGCYNLVIKKPASRGYENAPTVMLQGHLDMVCAKNASVQHDFLRDPIRLVVSDGAIRADGTTLGADNGIGVALCLAILDDEELAHPALEVVLTVDEERGMSGARGLDCSGLKSSILLNLDNGGEGVFTAGCAGGATVVYRIPYEMGPRRRKESFRLLVRGLSGGHSGADIHKGRGNAIAIIGRVLSDVAGIVDVSDIHGGSQTNVIPQEAEASVSCDRRDILERKVAEWDAALKNEYAFSDAGVRLALVEEPAREWVFDEGTKVKALAAIRLIPNGINTENREIGLVVSSLNLGVIENAGGSIAVKCLLRSSVDSNMETDLLPRMRTLAEALGIRCEVGGAYSGWQFEKESFVRDLCVRTYERMTSRTAKVSAIHAGLECGLLVGKMEKLDAVSFGPVMRGAHSPEESLDIPSVGRTYDFLAEILKCIA